MYSTYEVRNSQANKKEVRTNISRRISRKRVQKKRGFMNRNLIKLSFCGFLVLFICMAALINVMAQGSEKNVKKQYKSVMIDEGDTLWNIAKENNDRDISGVSISEYIEDIKSINNLNQDQITAGNYIIIPIYIAEEQ